MHLILSILGIFLVVVNSQQAPAQQAQFAIQGSAAESFPQFTVPGEPRLERLRELFFLHHQLAMRPPTHSMFALGWLPKATLWASPFPDHGKVKSHRYWQHLLENRRMDEDGYVSCHQHRGTGHSEGWPFPLWRQVGGMGWHFSVANIGYGHGNPYGLPETISVENWKLRGAQSHGIDRVRGWRITLKKPGASIKTPPMLVRTEVAPIIRLEWEAKQLGANAKPYLEWTTEEEPKFSHKRRIYFSPLNRTGLGYTDIFTHTHLAWKGTLTQLRINFGNEQEAEVTVRELITALDTRHNVNNAIYLQACGDTIRWSGDLGFLRKVIGPMRKALSYIMEEFETHERHCVLTRWAGHDGRSGISFDPEGNKILHHGQGVGGNYFDLLPFGGRDALATVYFYDALRRMVALEASIAAHPAWKIPPPPAELDEKSLAQHADEIKRDAGKLFWNQKTGRFVSAIDVDGESHDYGFTFLNLEAVYYGFTTPEQTTSIMDWVTGKRIVEGDTSQGADIYHWRFGPRATTLRNLGYYQSMWNLPESIPWGYQIQDGGAVLGFTYFDLMTRLQQYGPDNAWQRLQEILTWYQEVQQEGGYRKYYGKPGQEDRGSLQGGGTAGGIGVDREFMESVLASQVMLDGFMGLKANLNNLAISPTLPKDWPELTISKIHYHRHQLDITASDSRVLIRSTGKHRGPLNLRLRPGEWQVSYQNAQGKVIGQSLVVSADDEGVTVPINFRNAPVAEVRLVE